MALVCDYKSGELKPESESGEPNNEDLEDGEIEDDEEEEKPEQEQVAKPVPEQQQLQQPVKPVDVKVPQQPLDPTKFREEKDRPDKKRHEKKHLTEAEKSVMRLHKLERQEREKREKYRREQVCHPTIEPEEDFATSLEKAIAKVLKKDKPTSEDEKEEGVILPDVVKKGKKRKRKDKHNKKNKKNKQQESASEEFDDSEMLNMRGGSPDRERSPPALIGSPKSEEDYDSESSSDKSADGVVRKEKRKHGKRAFNRDRKFQDRSRERSRDREKRAKVVGKRNTGVCLYYLQGLCDDDACPYSHESVQPMKLELCKFYLLECCAKGDKCLYMHSDFPCKFYHTGIPCPYGEGCKFAHGGPLSDGLKQILFKHIETAPKEILGNFPRLSRENASVMILQAQKNLEGKYGPIKKEKDQMDSGKTDIPSLFEINFSNPPDSHQSDGDGKKENKRNRPSRWQDPDPTDKTDKHNNPMKMGFGMTGSFKDQDMRINSNGDVDMRTMNQPMIHTTNIVNPNILVQKPPMMGPPPGVIQPNILIPNILAQTAPNLLPTLLQQSGVGNQLQGVINSTLLNPNLIAQGVKAQQPAPNMQNDNNIVDIEKYKMEAAGMSKGGPDVNMLEASKKDTDIRQLDFSARDTDIRQLNKNIRNDEEDDENDSGLQIVMDDENKADDKTASYIDSLPKTQRELYKRILSQQKEKTIDDNQQGPENDNDQNIDWYSDDEDDNKLTIKDDFEDPKHDEEPKEAEPAPVKPLEVMEKLGDLSKIDISAEVTKLLTTMSQQPLSFGSSEPKQPEPRQEIRDPRLSTETRDPRQVERRPSDPRKSRVGSTEERSMSIYEQGSIADVGKDIDLRNTDKDLRTQFGDSDLRAGARPDVDLRQLNIPFKAMQNYTPATEIDASINSHPPLPWKVYIVVIPKPDYTGLKLSATDAQTTGDPRLRKIFRLSTEEKDSPASPKESPKATSAPTARVDPRRKKLEAEQQVKPPVESGGMTYTQQLAMLQSSPFYKSLTSNQKVMLNQELASRNDQTGMSDPIITAMLQNIGLISPGNQNPGGHLQAMNILATTMGGPPNFGQGLLGAGPPNIPNIPSDFPMNFDPRNGGMLPGVPGPPPPFGNFIPPPQEGNNFGGFNDDFYPDQGGNFNGNNGGNNNRDNNRGFRDRPRRGGRMNNRNNNRNYFRRHNRNRNSPP